MATVVQISDVHLRDRPWPATTRDDPEAGFLATIAALRATGVEPDLVVLSGDLADDGSVGACRRILRHVMEWNAPILAVAGNHDRPDSIAEVFGGPVAQGVGRWFVVPIDTYRDDAESGRLDGAAALAALDAAAGRPVLAVLHHPPASPSTHRVFGLEGGDELLDACARRPWVKALATGHLHESFDMTARGVRVVGAPSTWYALEHTGRQYRAAPTAPVGARIWELGDDGSCSHRLVERGR